MKFLAVYAMTNGDYSSHTFECDTWYFAADEAAGCSDGELILLTSMPPLVVHVVANYLASLTPVCKNTLNLPGDV